MKTLCDREIPTKKATYLMTYGYLGDMGTGISPPFEDKPKIMGSPGMITRCFFAPALPSWYYR